MLSSKTSKRACCQWPRTTHPQCCIDPKWKRGTAMYLLRIYATCALPSFSFSLRGRPEVSPSPTAFKSFLLVLQGFTGGFGIEPEPTASWTALCQRWCVYAAYRWIDDTMANLPVSLGQELEPNRMEFHADARACVRKRAPASSFRVQQ